MNGVSDAGVVLHRAEGSLRLFSLHACFFKRHQAKKVTLNQHTAASQGRLSVTVPEIRDPENADELFAGARKKPYPMD